VLIFELGEETRVAVISGLHNMVNASRSRILNPVVEDTGGVIRVLRRIAVRINHCDPHPVAVVDVLSPRRSATGVVPARDGSQVSVKAAWTAVGLIVGWNRRRCSYRLQGNDLGRFAWNSRNNLKRVKD